MERKALRRSLKRLGSVSTAYSGCGFFEHVCKSLCRHLNVRPPQFLHAFEISPVCRTALLADRQIKCVFGDLHSLYPPGIVKKMRRIQRRLMREAQRKLVAGQCLKRQAVADATSILQQALDGLLGGSEPARSAWCFRHKRECPIHFGHIHCAGTTCVDFSARSSTRFQGMGSHSLPFAVWLATRARTEEDVIIHECVAGFTPSDFMRWPSLRRNFIVRSFLISPKDFGRPATRKRRYTVLLHRRNLRDSLVRQPDPAVKFHFRVISNGNMWFSARDFDVHAYLAMLGATSCLDSLAPGSRRRLEEYHLWRRSSADPSACLICDVTQNAAHAKGTRQLMPCLLRASVPWSLTLGRCLLPWEAANKKAKKTASSNNNNNNNNNNNTTTTTTVIVATVATAKSRPWS